MDNVPYSFRTVCGFFNVPHQYCETGPKFYRPYPRRLENLTISDVITKAALSLSYLKTLRCWSSRGLNLRLPARQSGALGLPKRRNPYQSSPTFLCLKVPPCNLRPSIINSVPSCKGHIKDSPLREHDIHVTQYPGPISDHWLTKQGLTLRDKRIIQLKEAWVILNYQ